MGELRLEILDYTDQTRWRWVLTDANGSQIADHEVHLNTTDWQFEAFADLTGYLSWHVAPDRRRADEARIIAEVGTWIATQVLGPVAATLVDNRPATVMVTVPVEAEDILLRPLELARVGRRPLSVQDVTFVMRPASSSGHPKAAVPLENRIHVVTCGSSGGQEARKYSLIRPPRTGFRRIRLRSRSATARWPPSCSPSRTRWAMPWCGRAVL